MALFRHELKKILSMAALWVFVALCIAFNIIAAPTWLRNAGLDTTTAFTENVFANYDTSEIAEAYISMLGLTGRVAERMRAKYAALQLSVDEKAATGVSYSPYFGTGTHMMHLGLFHGVAGVVGRLLLQGMLLAALLALLATGYEQINNTEHTVYATKTGRHILRYKILASLAAGVGVYALLAGVTFAVYFSLFDFGGVWGSSVSSGFNYIVDIIGVRPFVTWHSFTVMSYLWASIGVSLGLIICFTLMGVIVGTLSKNGYIGFLMIVLINAVFMLLPAIIPMRFYAYFIPFHTPIWLWWNSGLWFTDAGVITLWRNFELWGLGLSFITLAALCALAVKKFEKRNIT